MTKCSSSSEGREGKKAKVKKMTWERLPSASNLSHVIFFGLQSAKIAPASIHLLHDSLSFTDEQILPKVS